MGLDLAALEAFCARALRSRGDNLELRLEAIPGCDGVATWLDADASGPARFLIRIDPALCAEPLKLCRVALHETGHCLLGHVARRQVNTPPAVLFAKIATLPAADLAEIERKNQAQEDEADAWAYDVMGRADQEYMWRYGRSFAGYISRTR